MSDRTKRLMGMALLSAALVVPLVRGDDAKAPPQPQQALEVRTYNISELLQPVQNYPLASESSGEFHGGANNPLFSGSTARPASSSDNGAALITTIEDSIDSDSWRDRGGSRGSIQIVGQSLVVAQSAADQAAIEKLLESLHHDAATNVMIAIDACWATLTPQQLDALETASEKDITGVEHTVLLDKDTSYCRGRVVGFNGQTVSVVSSQTATVVTGLTPVVSTGVAAYSVETQAERSGASLQVTPRLTKGRNTIVVDVHSKVVERSPRSRPAPAEIPATTQPAGMQIPDAAGLTAMIHNAGQPDRLDADLDTTIALTPGIPLIVGGMTRQPGDSQSRQLCLILTARALQ